MNGSKYYQLTRHDAIHIIRADGAFIPFNEGNTDYQAYLAWVAEGNTAEEWNPE